MERVEYTGGVLQDLLCQLALPLPAEPDGEPTGPASAQEPPSTGGQPTEPSGEPTGPASPLSTEAQGPSPMNLELKRACEEREARAQTVSSGAPPRAPLSTTTGPGTQA